MTEREPGSARGDGGEEAGTRAPGLPAHSSFAFVTGCQMAHVTCLAAARQGVYARAGWDLPGRGIAGAPPIRVVVGGKRHVTVTAARRG